MRTPFARAILVALSATLLPSVPVHAIETVNPAFWETNGTVRALAISGQTLYAGGEFSYVGPRTGPFAVCSRPEFTARPDLVRNGIAGTIHAVVSDGAGGWYIGGSFEANRLAGDIVISARNLAHIGPDGWLDSGFTPFPDGAVYTIAVSGTSLFVGGDFTQVYGATRYFIAKLNRTTGQPTSWNAQVDGTVRVLHPTGTDLLIAGAFGSVGPQSRPGLACVRQSNGTPTAFAPPAPDASVAALAVAGSTVYVGGSFSAIGAANRPLIAALNLATGAVLPWTAGVGTSGNVVSSLTIQGTSLFAGGRFDSVGGQPRANLAALHTATGAVTAWNPQVLADDFSVMVHALALDGSTLIVGGDFDQVGGQARRGVAEVSVTTGTPTAWSPTVGGEVSALAVAGADVAMGGGFTSVGGASRANLAAFDIASGTALPWNPGADATVHAVAVAPGAVYAGGAFTSAGGSPRLRVAALDPTTGVATAWNPGANATVYALLARPSEVIVGGAFSSLGGQVRNGLGAIEVASGGVTGWNPAPSGMFNFGGTFFPPIVYALGEHDGDLFVGGRFGGVGGVAGPMIGAVSFTTGLATPWRPNTAYGPEWRVEAIASPPSGIAAGGFFFAYGGVNQINAGVVDPVTAIAFPWGPPFRGTVHALAVQDTSLIVGGLPNPPIPALSRVSPTTGVIAPWLAPELDGEVFAIATMADRIFAGGSMSAAPVPLAEFSRRGLVAYDVTASSGVEPGSRPGGLRLSAWPMPIRGEGVLRFELPQADEIRAVLYDSSGRRAKTLIEEARFEAGAHSRRWNSTGLEPGVYWLRLSSSMAHADRRVVVLQ